MTHEIEFEPEELELVYEALTFMAAQFDKDATVQEINDRTSSHQLLRQAASCRLLARKIELTA